MPTGLNDPDGNVRNAYEYAVKQIEGAKEEKPDETQAERQRALLKGISAFRKGLPAEPKEVTALTITADGGTGVTESRARPVGPPRGGVDEQLSGRHLQLSL